VLLLLEKYVVLRVAFTEKSSARQCHSCVDSTECVRIERAFVKSNYTSHAFLKTKSHGLWWNWTISNRDREEMVDSHVWKRIV